MARKKTPSKLASTRKRLSGRLLELRVAQYGIRGGPEMARSLDVPARSWYNYESGVTVPGEIIRVCSKQVRSESGMVADWSWSNVYQGC